MAIAMVPKPASATPDWVEEGFKEGKVQIFAGQEAPGRRLGNY